MCGRVRASWSQGEVTAVLRQDAVEHVPASHSSHPPRVGPVRDVPLSSMRLARRVSRVVRCRSLALVTAVLVVLGCDATKPLPPAVLVTPATLTLEDGQTAKLNARLRNPKSRTVRWSSSNTAVATVDLSGTVTGVTNGTANIFVKMVDDSTVFAMVPVPV